jgi:hypothetical protein
MPGAHQETQGTAVEQIVQVDGKDLSCIQAGCPVWVRVIPGDHTFRIRCTTITLVGPLMNKRQSELDLPFTAMQARHVYEAKCLIDKNSSDPSQSAYRVDVKDLGLNPDFGHMIRLKYHRVSFED